jgi:glycosyltransferase involved in cell wall biosynthesis
MTWHYPPALGGSEKMAQRLVHALAATGHSVEVWTARRADAPASEQLEPSISVRRFLHGLSWGPLFGLTVFLQTAISLWKHRRRFDVIHSHQTSWGALGALAVRPWIRKPVLIRVASSGPLNDVKLIRERKGGSLLIRLLGRADTIIALCRAARDEVVRYGQVPPERIRIVPNGVDLSQFDAASPEEAEPATLLYVGRLHPIKGVDLLLRALAHLRRTHPEARLLILGDGEARDDLESLASTLGLTTATDPEAGAHVRFLGLQDDPRPYYRCAGVVVLPSRTEGMSNVLIEAMAASKPVVATAVGGNVDLLDPEDRRSTLPESAQTRAIQGANGILVPPADPETLADGIRLLLDNPELARDLGGAARRYAEHHCALEAVAQRYLDLYRDRIHKASSTPP